SDAMIYFGLFTNSADIGAYGMIGHALSGPSVHVAHLQFAKAALSFLLETAPAGTLIGVAVASDHGCKANCTTGLRVVEIGFPIALAAGMVIDVTLLGRMEVTPETKDNAPASPTVSLAPLVVPPFSATMERGLQKRWSREMPVGLALVGQF